MKITFIGVGEACDSSHPNTSVLVEEEALQARFLLDCGFTSAHSYFNLIADPIQLDGIWVSHFHGDHFFGIPLLILRFWEAGREKPLQIIGPSGVKEKITSALELAYQGFTDKLRYPLQFQEISPDKDHDVLGFHVQTAPSEHSRLNLSLRLSSGRKSIFYSGDGRPSASSRRLTAGCDLVIHEAFRFQKNTTGHGSIVECIDLCRQADVSRLALVHIFREDRNDFLPAIQKLITETEDIEILLPVTGEQLKL